MAGRCGTTAVAAHCDAFWNRDCGLPHRPWKASTPRCCSILGLTQRPRPARWLVAPPIAASSAATMVMEDGITGCAGRDRETRCLTHENGGAIRAHVAMADCGSVRFVSDRFACGSVIAPEPPGFRQVWNGGLVPALGVVGSVGNTALTASLVAGGVIDLDAKALRPTGINEPLVDSRSLHAREGAGALEHVSLQQRDDAEFLPPVDA